MLRFIHFLFHAQVCNLVSKRDLKCLAGLNNIEVDAKESVSRLKIFLDSHETLGMEISNLDVT